MIIMLILFSLWFGFSMYIHEEMRNGVLYWVVTSVNLFVIIRFASLPGDPEDGWKDYVFLCAVFGLSFFVEFVLRKCISRFSKRELKSPSQTDTL